MCRSIGYGALALLLASSVPATAQIPQQTTATYGDWTVRCEFHGTTKTCEMDQTSQMQGRLLSQIAIGRPSKAAPFHIVVQVPIKVWLPAGVTLVTNEKAPGLTAPFKRCRTNGCFADTDLPEAVLKKLRTETKNGKLLFKNEAQKLVTIPVSFKGFAPAFDAMGRE
ncbi:MAG: invasion associated locus B family protein [Bradyrhizobium sp.]